MISYGRKCKWNLCQYYENCDNVTCQTYLKDFSSFFLALNIFQLGGVNLNRESVYTGSNLNFLVAGDKTILKSMPCMLLNIVAEECAYNTCHNAHSILY